MEPMTMTDIDVATAVIWVSLWALCAICSYNIGKNKGRGGDSLALGLLLGPIGVIVTARLQQATPGPQVTLRGDGWWPDPFCHRVHRYYDGKQWTDYVSDMGTTSVEPTLELDESRACAAGVPRS